MTENKVTYYELDIHVPEENKEFIAEILTELGIDNFVLGSIDCDVEAEYNPQAPRHDYYTELVKETPVVIYSEDKEYLESVQKSLEHVLTSIQFPYDQKTFLIKPIADQNWQESWKASFKPILIEDKIAILPPWENPSQFGQTHKIIINPGMAFGTGQHETTRLCLEVMLKYNIPSRVMDVGTGSGILAIAAAKLGATHIVANDLDPDCMRIALENAEVNQTQHIIFTNSAIEEIVEKEFEMIIANIQSRPLKAIMPSIRDHITDKGIVILSGILVAEMQDFKEFLKSQKMLFIENHIMGDWCSLVCKKSLN
ncbi:50S ribosomal protein L11 methyltransferase [Silvanigrella aquatica]|uniref:Ribosomal protein L11 methyltransferase n=1 Tax=Silvanigrella aquatica TaxID=1915309 RepID=A0A1L4D358_9BACT|nr:50S ribosomal protein L11 methyltransferase [Silvanigrella aquatica]APJ04622.1 ribosomal protein L11 methyltransferase [Silvanigrella aquatica]